MTTGADQPTESEVVQTAATAAEDVIFSRLSNAEVRDFDVTVQFADEMLEVDVYLDAPDAANADQIAEDAMLAARMAADDLLA